MTVVGDRGLDVAWDEPPSWQHAADVGYRFVIQYLSTDASKNADPEDRDAQRAAGLDEGYVWETTANRSTAGYDAGKADAVEANRQAGGLGVPAYVAIYFATDFDANPDQVRAYYQGARDGSARPVGCYGGIRVVDAMLAEGIVHYGWQTVAWSKGALSGLAHLYQRVGRTLPDPGGSTDENVCLKADCGLWSSTVAPQPPPAPAPGPPPPPRNPFTPLGVDGQFGPQTTKALQWAIGTPADGSFGPFSKQALQRRVGTSPDGAIGPITIRAMQARIGAGVDGVWGPQTTRKLQEALNAGTF